ncbi:hypothetical protein ACQY0O_005928 [Thecaphora frezii]
MTTSHGYLLEYPRIRVDHFDQGLVPLPKSILAHRRAVLSDRAHDDAFSADQRYFLKPLLYLLTHIHTDHLGGLDRPGINAPIYCSHATKDLLLRYERQKDRVGYDNDGGGLVRPYAHLQISDRQANAKNRLSGTRASAQDLLQPLPYNYPTEVPYTPRTRITLTLLESNHMFGSTMFLVEGPRGAVLHTGDLRAEGWWCEALVRNAAISRYIAWDRSFGRAALWKADDPWADAMQQGPKGQGASTAGRAQQVSQETNTSSDQDTQRIVDRHDGDDALPASLRLESIYLDTEMLLTTHTVPSKEQAVQDMVVLLRMYPPDTLFFLNSWTWGYEAMLKAVAKAFGSRVHVDRFKAGMYKAARCEDPFLSQIITLDPGESRFHACERNHLCSALQGSFSDHGPSDHPGDVSVSVVRDNLPPEERWGPARQDGDAPLVVFVNPAQISEERWAHTFKEARLRLNYARQGRTFWPRAVLVPIERHSPLPELRQFVDLFRPKTVSPNTILDTRGGLDYYLLHHLFGPYLAPGGTSRLAADGLALLGDRQWSFFEQQIQLARYQSRPGACDSLEVHASGSGSATSQPRTSRRSDGDGAIGNAEIEALSKKRGVASKFSTMQNMAGNLAAVLEIERWRKEAGVAEGISLPAAGSYDEADASADLSESGGKSGITAGYDADQSQAAEMTLRPPSASFFEAARGSSAQSSGNQADCAPDLPAAPLDERNTPLDATVEASVVAATAVAAVEGALEIAPTVLDELLALRYLNVLIHHFSIPYVRRADIGYVDMWKQVRFEIPKYAVEVEELCHTDQGIRPPLWTCEPAAPEHGPEATANARLPALPSHPHMQRSDIDAGAQCLEDNGGARPGERGADPPSERVAAPSDEPSSSWFALETTLDLLEADTNPSDARNSLLSELVDVDVEMGYCILLDRFRTGQICDFHLTDDAFSSETGSDAAQGRRRLWHSLSPRLYCVLSRDLDRLRDAFQSFASAAGAAAPSPTLLRLGEACVKTCALILACRQVSQAFEVEHLRRLIDGLLTLIESSSRAASATDAIGAGIKRILTLALFALQNEELHREVIEPLEERLLNAAQGPMKALMLVPAQLARDMTMPAGPDDDADGEARAASPGMQSPAAPAEQTGPIPGKSSGETSVSSTPTRPPQQGRSASQSLLDNANGHKLAPRLIRHPSLPAVNPATLPRTPPQPNRRAVSPMQPTRARPQGSQDTTCSSTQPEESTQEEEAAFPSLKHLAVPGAASVAGTGGGPSRILTRTIAAREKRTTDSEDRYGKRQRLAPSVKGSDTARSALPRISESSVPPPRMVFRTTSDLQPHEPATTTSGRRALRKNLSDTMLLDAPTSSLADPLGRLRRYDSQTSQATTPPAAAAASTAGTKKWETRECNETPHRPAPQLYQSDRSRGRKVIVALDTPDVPHRTAAGTVRRSVRRA